MYKIVSMIHTSSALNSIYLGAILFSTMIFSCKTSDSSDPGTNGFVRIFNGKTLEGWKGDPAYWSVENGNLVGEVTPTKPLQRNTFIIWEGGQPRDFELKAEFKITENGNSGINYRSVALDNIPFALKGYQADIDGRNRYTGQNYEERARTTLAYRGEEVLINSSDNPSGSLGDYIRNNAWTERTVKGSLGDAETLGIFIKIEDWNEIHLIVNGNRMRHYVNGVLMSDVIDNDSINYRRSGLLGVQVHVGPPMKVQYKNLRLKHLKR